MQLLLQLTSCAILPIATGGGPIIRGGAKAAQAATAVVTHVPAEVRALQATEKLLQFAISNSGGGQKSNQGHHPWPQYLGGSEKQELYNLSDKLHSEYHTQLDKYLNRKYGNEYFAKLFNNPSKQNQLLEALLEFNKYFDEIYKTHTYETLEDILRDQGLLPKPKGR